MTTRSSQQYLENLLTRQELSAAQEDTLQRHKNEVTDYLRARYGTQPVIKYAGSHEKDTLIAEKYDLDIVCYFPSSDRRSLKEIREDVAQHLRTTYSIRSKASAERILDLRSGHESNAYHIDVVPGRFIQDTSDVFLHVATGDRERLQTNLKTHIDHIAGSGCIPIIRLAKFWACRDQVDVKTFVLELFVIQSLSGSRSKNDLPRSLWTVFEALRDDFRTTRLVDPANTGNVVTDLIPAEQKAAVAAAAATALRQIGTITNSYGWAVALGDPDAGVGLFASDDLGRDPGEQFLSDYGIPEQLVYDVQIDAVVTQDGFRPFALRSWSRLLKKKRSLLFKVVRCTVPPPYSIKWKIKNRGREATDRHVLRGEIVDDQGQGERKESTRYAGAHYVECYVIKNGVCAAKDHIDVPIGTSA